MYNIIYHTEIYNCIVVGQLSGYSEYLYTYSFFFLLIFSFPTHTANAEIYTAEKQKIEKTKKINK